MSDFEDVDDFFMESWISTEKKKRKKGSKKDKKGIQPRKNVNMKKQESIQKKKKKKTKFKEAMEAKKDKKKEKKKKKKKVALEDSARFPQMPEESEPSLNERMDHVLPDSMESTKRKKKVTLDLVPHSIHAKRFKLVSSTPRGEEDPGMVSDSSCQLTAGQVQAHDHDSQCTSDDINSQDLFITQKTFRTLASEPSSEEAKAFTESPPTQKDKRQLISVVGIEQFYDDKCLQDSCQTNTERRGKCSLQTQMKVKSPVSKEKKGSSPELNVVNPNMDEPKVVDPFVNVAKKKLSLLQSPVCPPLSENVTLLPPSTTSISTQTENFFTSELSSYLNFCKKVRSTVCFQDVKPLDLSLKQRLKKDVGGYLSGKMLEEKIKDEQRGKNKNDMYPSDSSQIKGVKKDHSGTPSPQSESEHKSANTTNSSEDSGSMGRTSKLDLNQIRAVQTRLNECFFFKTKGDGKSPRAESPLMKLVQGRDNKSKKGQ